MIWIILGWLVCGIGGAGIFIAYFQRKFPLIAMESYKQDLTGGIIWGLLGPVGLVLGFFLSGFMKHGWGLRPLSKQ